MVHNIFSPKRSASSSAATPILSTSDGTAAGSFSTSKGDDRPASRGLRTPIKFKNRFSKRSMSSSDVPTTPTKGDRNQDGDQQDHLTGVLEQDDSRKEEESIRNGKPGLFYAYARRTDHPAFSRYILTFSSAAVCDEWYNLLHNESEFASAEPVRESAQLFSFKGDDVPGRIWRHKAFDGMKTKWFYTQIGDATGTTGRAQSILPIMSADGSVVSSPPPAAGETPKNVRFEDKASAGESNFDFNRLEQNLGRISQLLEAAATKNGELEQRSTAQAQTIDELKSALQQSAQQIRALSEGQQKLLGACDELRKAVKERDERWDKMSTMGSAASVASGCGHEIRRPPRKVGRKIIGYVYGGKDDGVPE